MEVLEVLEVSVRVAVACFLFSQLGVTYISQTKW